METVKVPAVTKAIQVLLLLEFSLFPFLGNLCKHSVGFLRTSPQPLAGPQIIWKLTPLTSEPIPPQHCNLGDRAAAFPLKGDADLYMDWGVATPTHFRTTNLGDGISQLCMGVKKEWLRVQHQSRPKVKEQTFPDFEIFMTHHFPPDAVHTTAMHSIGSITGNEKLDKTVP